MASSHMCGTILLQYTHLSRHPLNYVTPLFSGCPKRRDPVIVRSEATKSRSWIPLSLRDFPLPRIPLASGIPGSGTISLLLHILRLLRLEKQARNDNCDTFWSPCSVEWDGERPSSCVAPEMCNAQALGTTRRWQKLILTSFLTYLISVLSAKEYALLRV